MVSACHSIARWLTQAGRLVAILYDSISLHRTPGGFGWTTSKGTLLDVVGSPLAPFSYRVNGPVAGLFLGGNYQINKIVLGVEGDWQWSNLLGNNQILAPLGSTGTFTSGPFWFRPL